MAEILIHPAVDGGLKPAAKDFTGGTLRCHCTNRPVEVKVTTQCAHNHVCGCTQCWKPKGALFSQVAVAPRANVVVTQNGDKLKLAVPPTALIQRQACTVCGVHMQGPVERPNHPFTGLVFIHTELSKERGGRRRRSRLSSRRSSNRGRGPRRWAPSAAASRRWACRPTTACARR